MGGGTVQKTAAGVHGGIPAAGWETKTMNYVLLTFTRTNKNFAKDLLLCVNNEHKQNKRESMFTNILKTLMNMDWKQPGASVRSEKPHYKPIKRSLLA